MGKRAFFSLLLIFLLTAAEESSFPAEKGLIPLTVKGKKIYVEVARTEEEKGRGLMFRENLKKDEGMLFVYEREEILSYWMKNTRIPLSIAFIDGKGKIVDIQDMRPFSLQGYVSRFPAKYALEVNEGWFQKNGINAGDLVRFPAGFKE